MFGVMSAHPQNPTAGTSFLNRLVQLLRFWRIALIVYTALAVLAAGWLSATAGTAVLFAGFSAIMLFVFRLRAEIATLRMHRQFQRIAELRFQQK